jgi:hypothetical protein
MRPTPASASNRAIAYVGCAASVGTSTSSCGRSIASRSTITAWTGSSSRSGELDYGFHFGGILGMDFLRAAHAILDLGALTLVFPR